MSHRLSRLALGLLVLAGVTLSATRAGAAPAVAIVGDSISDRSREAIGHAVEPGHHIVWFETQNSATIARMRPALLEEVSRPDGPDIVLVELGTGNAFWGTDPDDFRHQVHQLTRALLEHVTCVRWFEQKPGGTLAYKSINKRAALFNRIVRDEVNRFAHARTVHYEAWTAMAGDSVFVPDLLHLNAHGKHGLARLSLRAVDGCDPAVTSGRFWDVPDRYWAAAEIDWVGGHHLIDGYPNGTYRAEVGGIIPTLDRVDWVKALWRRAGRPGGYPSAPWPDAHGLPLAWAGGAEVTQVPAGSDFRPEHALSRADAVQWLYRAAGRPDVSGYPAHGLLDVPAGLERAVRWAKGTGIVTTPDGGRFDPRHPVSRAEAAVYLFRAAHPVPPPPGPPASVGTSAPTTTVPPSTVPTTTPSTTTTTTAAPATPTTTAIR